MKDEEILERFKAINVWANGDRRAPHKPLLILYALGKCSRNEERLIGYREIDEKLGTLLKEFGPPSPTKPQYPFWRLQKDKLWEIHDKDLIKFENKSGDMPRPILLERNSQGGLPEKIYTALSQNKQLLSDAAQRLLAANFPETMHQDILDAIGLDSGLIEEKKKGKRDPGFRDRVIRAYEHKCAVCGYDLRLGDQHIGLEAAHIKWHEAGGPDTEDNGLALCVLHHKVFDRGAFTLSAEHRIQVSQHVNGSNMLELLLTRFHNREARKPQRNEFFPNGKYLKWHWEEVFANPAK